MTSHSIATRDKKSVMGPGFAETMIDIGGLETTTATVVMTAAFDVWVIPRDIIWKSADLQLQVRRTLVVHGTKNGLLRLRRKYG